MEENKTQRKQTKHKRVFFRFGDQSCGRAGNHYPKAARTRRPQSAGRRKIRAKSEVVIILVGGCDGEVADRIRHGTLPSPRNRGSIGVAERSCPGDANAHRIQLRVVNQIDMTDGSGARRRGDLWQVGGVGRQGMIASRAGVAGGSAWGEELGAAARKVC